MEVLRIWLIKQGVLLGHFELNRLHVQRGCFEKF